MFAVILVKVYLMGSRPVVAYETYWHTNHKVDRVCSRAKNKVWGLAGQAEILIGHLYNLMQTWSNFWVAIVENCMENGQWPAAILSSV